MLGVASRVVLRAAIRRYRCQLVVGAFGFGFCLGDDGWVFILEAPINRPGVLFVDAFDRVFRREAPTLQIFANRTKLKSHRKYLFDRNAYGFGSPQCNTRFNWLGVQSTNSSCATFRAATLAVFKAVAPPSVWDFTSLNCQPIESKLSENGYLAMGAPQHANHHSAHLIEHRRIGLLDIACPCQKRTGVLFFTNLIG
ncbi:hypothetical protein [Uliginosibacterium sp. TH139]|uniref:hypothetical protein n=1 Tax=Uliginosibacterium sp. TH139 TaxID=2067453 RepID=UPI00117D10B1